MDEGCRDGFEAYNISGKRVLSTEKSISNKTK